MSNLFAYDRALELAHANERFWSTMGSHEPVSSPVAVRLATFFRDEWNPWYTRVMLLAAHELDDAQQARLAKNIADQLVGLRDVAGYKYQLLVDDGDGARGVDAELAQISADADETMTMLALNASWTSGSRREVLARRAPPMRR